MRFPSSTSTSSAHVDGQSCGQTEFRISLCMDVEPSARAAALAKWRQPETGRPTMLTRRTLLASSVAAPAVLRQARAATPKGIVVMAKQIDDIVSFDPAESYEFTNGEVDANCYRRLIRPDLNDVTKIEADLAEKWEISKDGLTFTFHLRRDAAFDSGNPVTANDAAGSLHRVVKLNKTPGFIITQFGFNPDNVEKMIHA